MSKTFLTSKEQMKTAGHQGWPSLFNAGPFFDVLQTRPIFGLGIFFKCVI